MIGVFLKSTCGTSLNSTSFGSILCENALAWKIREVTRVAADGKTITKISARMETLQMVPQRFCSLVRLTTFLL